MHQLAELRTVFWRLSAGVTVGVLQPEREQVGGGMEGDVAVWTNALLEYLKT